MLYISTKAQAWVMDFLLAIFIFSVTMILFYKTLPNLELQATNPLEDVYLDAKTIASMVVSPGSPGNWTPDDVDLIGITESGNVISGDKVKYFHNISREEYQDSKMLLGITSDYIIFFLDKGSGMLPINGSDVIGDPRVSPAPGPDHTNLSSIDTRNLVKLERVLFFNESPVRMVIYTWN